MDEWQPPPLSIRVPWDAEVQRRLAGKLFPRPDDEKGTRRHRGKPRQGVPSPWLSSRPAIVTLGVLMVGAASVLGWSWLGARMPAPLASAASTSTTSPPQADREIWFRDGSLALLQGPESELRVDVADAHAISATLIAGRARFDVVPRRERLFRIQAGAVIIEVLGTAFSVEHHGLATLVAVTRGRVRVSWPGGTRELPAGSEGLFPPPEAALAGDPTVAGAGSAPIAAQAPEAKAAEPPLRHAAAETRPAVTLAELDSRRSTRGPEEARPADPSGTLAPSALPPPPSSKTAPPHFQPVLAPSPARSPAARLADGSTPQTNSSDLLLGQADLARIAGRPDDAVELLRQLLRQSAGDGRAPLAAFTLGRILLDELQAPQQAAEAFAQARDLAPTGPLVEDTYLREVEAWLGAGQPARATARAREYLDRFSGSARAPLMRRLIAPL